MTDITRRNFTIGGALAAALAGTPAAAKVIAEVSKPSVWEIAVMIGDEVVASSPAVQIAPLEFTNAADITWLADRIGVVDLALLRDGSPILKQLSAATVVTGEEVKVH